MSKIKFEHFFKTQQVRDVADLIVTRIEEHDKYYIHKDKSGTYEPKSIIDCVTFRFMLKHSMRPIVLSDFYIDLSE